MKKIILFTLILNFSLFGLSAQKVVESKCISCHELKSTMAMMVMSNRKIMHEKMLHATAAEKEVIKKTMREKIKNSGMKAPPMPMLSMRLKMMTKTEEEFIAFVKDYIQHPNKEKGFCMPMAYEHFGVMPAMKMGEDELEKVAFWLYHNFNDKWEESMDGMLCDMDNNTTLVKEKKEVQ